MEVEQTALATLFHSTHDALGLPFITQRDGVPSLQTKRAGGGVKNEVGRANVSQKDPYTSASPAAKIDYTNSCRHHECGTIPGIHFVDVEAVGLSVGNSLPSSVCLSYDLCCRRSPSFDCRRRRSQSSFSVSPRNFVAFIVDIHFSYVCVSLEPDNCRQTDRQRDKATALGTFTLRKAIAFISLKFRRILTTSISV